MGLASVMRIGNTYLTGIGSRCFELKKSHWATATLNNWKLKNFNRSHRNYTNGRLVWNVGIVHWCKCFYSLCYSLRLPESNEHGAHLGPTGPRWAPCWPHEPCYLGCSLPLGIGCKAPVPNIWKTRPVCPEVHDYLLAHLWQFIFSTYLQYQTLTWL